MNQVKIIALTTSSSSKNQDLFCDVTNNLLAGPDFDISNGDRTQINTIEIRKKSAIAGYEANVEEEKVFRTVRT